MPTVTRTFRVFVSSTFEDLKAERDALQRDVFPRLRKLCEENTARFQAIDLRWGVRDEAALDQQTMEICLREIERCQQTGIKPNFIVLLGERYGWRPLPARIEAGEFEKVCQRAADADKRLIDDWYARDENAVPTEFLLKPRTGEFADKDRWGEVEQKLHRMLRAAARDAGLAPESLIKYEASATHQEILKGLGQSEEDRRHVFAFFREPTEGATVDVDGAAADGDLDALKQDLRHKLPEGNVRPFQVGETEKLCKDVEESLKKVILDEASRFTSRDALDLEIEAHDRFARDRCRIFVGRGDALKAIADYVKSPDRRPLVLHGESGSGKSAVMAKASQQHIGPGRMMRRFIGASPESASGHALLTSLCKQIAQGETPVDYYQLEKAFQERLAGVTVERPLVLFIDALDQLSASDPARTAYWLPAELPPFVKVIVSTTDDGERLPTGLPVRLERMTTAEGGQALDELLREARRTLPPWQRDRVLAHFERCGLPLYLKLAADESRPWKSFSPPDACALGEGIAGILDTLFDRLASNANHGPVLVERSLGYLAAARYGLTEGEMLDVLTADDAVWSDFDVRKHHEVSERRLPVVVWSRLSLNLEPYLTERAALGGTVIAFYHRQLAERVVARFLAGGEAQARHRDLASYFYPRPSWLDEGLRIPNPRRAAELIFQQREAQQWRQAEATLFDCPFLFAKVAAGMVLDLDTEYQLLLQDAPETELLRRDDLRLMQGTLRLSLYVLAKDRGQFASQMTARLLGHQDEPAMAAFLKEVDTFTPRPRLWPLWPELEAPGGPLLRIFKHDAGFPVTAVALSADGRRAASGSLDETVRIWDLEGNQLPRILEGHAGSVNAVALSADGKRVVSGSGDRTVRIWDLEGNQLPRILKGHTESVTGVALSADGKRVVSGSNDRTVRIWDLEGNQRPRILEGHSGSVNAVALSADGKRSVSGSWDQTVRVWDLEGNHLPRILEGHTGCVAAVALSGDGMRAISGSFDCTLRIWDLEGNQPARVLEGHTGWVEAVALSANGMVAASGSGISLPFSDYKTLRVWDLESDQPPRILEDNGRQVCAVSLSGDGRIAVSSADETLRVWDLAGKRSPSVLKGDAEQINTMVMSRDGKRAVSISKINALQFWDLEDDAPPRVLEDHTDSIWPIALSADGKRAVSASKDNTLHVWDLDGDLPPLVLDGHSDSVRVIAVSATGERIVSVSKDNTLRVWDLKGNQTPCILKCHKGEIVALALSADGRRAVSRSGRRSDKTLRVWDLESNKRPKILRGHVNVVNSVVLSADGRRAVSCSDDKTVRVWDLDGNRPPRILEGHTDFVTAVALSANGQRIVSGSRDETMLVWDLETNWPPRLLDGDTWVRAVALSANGQYAVSAGSWDKTVRVWDLESGKCLSVFSCDDDVAECAWAGKRIVVSGSGRVHLFAWEA